MKKACLVAAILLVIASTTAFAQQKNEVSVDLFEPVPTYFLLSSVKDFRMAFNLHYQRVIDDHWTILASPMMVVNFDEYGLHYLWLTPWIEADWHPWGGGLAGFYVGPAISLPMYFRVTQSQLREIAIAVGAVVGYNILLPYGIDVDIAVGMTPFYYSFSDQELGLAGFLSSTTKAEISIGYRF